MSTRKSTSTINISTYKLILIVGLVLIILGILTQVPFMMITRVTVATYFISIILMVCGGVVVLFGLGLNYLQKKKNSQPG